jgi:hypothetical protein
MSTTSAAASAFGRARAPFDAAVERARLTVVPHRRPARAPRMPFVTLVSVVLLGGIVGLLCFNTQMQQASFTAATLEERAANLSAREQTLHSELQALRDPQHVAVLATRAGMVAPTDACTLKLGAGSSNGSCTPANRDNTPSPFSPPPPKPPILDPAPVVVKVAGQAGGNAGGNAAWETTRSTRDTGRR